MQNKFTRRHFIVTATTTLCASSGCGTLLYPERVGQRRGNFDNIDWTVVGMDSIGLIFFFVPGVIAFAIDFYNGSMFLPGDCYGNTESTELKTVFLPEKNRSLGEIERLLATETGHTIKLERGNYFTRKLDDIKQFWPTRRQFEANA